VKLPPLGDSLVDDDDDELLPDDADELLLVFLSQKFVKSAPSFVFGLRPYSLSKSTFNCAADLASFTICLIDFGEAIHINRTINYFLILIQ
jgi:hypothetical protein